jgi:hypothetical protein
MDGKEVSWGGVDSIPVGQQKTINSDGGPRGDSYWIAEPGKHALSVNIDDQDAIVCESNKKNNYLRMNLNVPNN